MKKYLFIFLIFINTLIADWTSTYLANGYHFVYNSSSLIQTKVTSSQPETSLYNTYNTYNGSTFETTLYISLKPPSGYYGSICRYYYNNPYTYKDSSTYVFVTKYTSCVALPYNTAQQPLYNDGQEVAENCFYSSTNGTTCYQPVDNGTVTPDGIVCNDGYTYFGDGCYSESTPNGDGTYCIGEIDAMKKSTESCINYDGISSVLGLNTDSNGCYIGGSVVCNDGSLKIEHNWNNAYLENDVFTIDGESYFVDYVSDDFTLIYNPDSNTTTVNFSNGVITTFEGSINDFNNINSSSTNTGITTNSTTGGITTSSGGTSVSDSLGSSGGNSQTSGQSGTAQQSDLTNNDIDLNNIITVMEELRNNQVKDNTALNNNLKDIFKETVNVNTATQNVNNSVKAVDNTLKAMADTLKDIKDNTDGYTASSSTTGNTPDNSTNDTAILDDYFERLTNTDEISTIGGNIETSINSNLNSVFTNYSNVLGFGSDFGMVPDNITLTLFNTNYTLIDFAILDNYVDVIRSLFLSLAYITGFLTFLRGSK